MAAARTLALDVALLLPEEVRGRALAANRLLLERHPEGLVLDETHIPHVTLVQQCCRDTDLADVEERIHAIAGSTPALGLRVPGPGRGGSTAWFLIEKTPALQRLHEDLVAALAPFAGAPLEDGSFCETGGEKPRDRDRDWVRFFRERSSGERFEPHVTLGVGDLPADVAPFSFVADRLALCQLGRFCTCRVVIDQWQLATASRSGRQAGA